MVQAKKRQLVTRKDKHHRRQAQSVLATFLLLRFSMVVEEIESSVVAMGASVIGLACYRDFGCLSLMTSESLGQMLILSDTMIHHVG